MNTTTKSAHRLTIALALPKRVPALIVYAEGIVQRMTGNPSFPSPQPPLAAITAAINDLRAAETAALARTKGAVAARNEKRTVLLGALQQLRAHVQSLADADPANAASIIESAGVAGRPPAARAPSRRNRGPSPAWRRSRPSSRPGARRTNGSTAPM